MAQQKRQHCNKNKKLFTQKRPDPKVLRQNQRFHQKNLDWKSKKSKKRFEKHDLPLDFSKSPYGHFLAVAYMNALFSLMQSPHQNRRQFRSKAIMENQSSLQNETEHTTNSTIPSKDQSAYTNHTHSFSNTLQRSPIPPSFFFKKEPCLDLLHPGRKSEHFDRIKSDLSIAINKKMNQITQNPDDTLCRYFVTQESFILKFKDQDQPHYAVAFTTKQSVGKGGTGTVSKICPLVQMHGKWHIAPEVRLVKELNFDPIIGKKLISRLENTLENLNCVVSSEIASDQEKDFHILKKLMVTLHLSLNELNDRAQFFKLIAKNPKNKTHFTDKILRMLDEKHFIDEETMRAPQWINELSFGSHGFCISAQQNLRILDMALIPGKPIMHCDFQQKSFFKKVHVALQLYDAMQQLYELGYTHGDIEKGNNILYDEETDNIALIDFQFLTSIVEAPEFVRNDLRQISYVLDQIFSKEREYPEEVQKIKAFLDAFPKHHSKPMEGYDFFKTLQHEIENQHHISLKPKF